MSIPRFIPALGLAALVAACSDNANPPTAIAPATRPSAQVVTAPSLLSGIPVTGTQTVGNVTSSFAGLLNITSLATNAAGQLVGSGTITDLAGNVLGTLTNVPLTLAGSGPGNSCQILQLDIGAIHLNLLGLTLDLAPIHLNLAAQPGAGNLLGNLLCAVAHLLDNGNLAALQNLLNQINAILAGL